MALGATRVDCQRTGVPHGQSVGHRSRAAVGVSDVCACLDLLSGDERIAPGSGSASLSTLFFFFFFFFFHLC